MLKVDGRGYVSMRHARVCRPAVEAIARGLFALVPKQALNVLTAEVN